MPLDLPSLVPSGSELRSFFTVEPTRTMQADGYPWPHEIRVALPPSYAGTDRNYPVLWLTDNTLEAALSVLPVADLILVGVGAGELSVKEFGRRRIYDFYPMEDWFPAGRRREYARRAYQAFDPDLESVGGGAARFLDFLVDDVRPALEAEYRMDPRDHALLGYSAGGAFVTFAVFARPGAYAKYICGSPGLYAGNHALFDLEAAYAAEHDDLAAEIFFAAGDGEIDEPLIDAFGAVSSVASIAETLSFRGYPSLRLVAKIIPGENHATMLPHVISWGVRSLWGDAVLRP